MAARRLLLSTVVFLSLLSLSSSCVRDLEEEQEEVTLLRERRAEACGSLVTKICEKCAYCKCDGGCDGCAKCSSCVKNGVFSRKGPGCRWAGGGAGSSLEGSTGGAGLPSLPDGPVILEGARSVLLLLYGEGAVTLPPGKCEPFRLPTPNI